jgi:hypothetical protein
MYLTIEDSRLLAITYHRQVVICKVTTADRVQVTSKYYGVSIALAYEVLDNGLRISRLLRAKELS